MDVVDLAPPVNHVFPTPPWFTENKWACSSPISLSNHPFRYFAGPWIHSSDVPPLGLSADEERQSSIRGYRQERLLISRTYPPAVVLKTAFQPRNPPSPFLRPLCSCVPPPLLERPCRIVVPGLVWTVFLRFQIF